MADCQDEGSRDSELVRQAAAGDHQAFGLLYDRYSLGIYRFLRAHLSDPYEAENFTSEVFLRAWQSLTTYQERGYPFSSYLYRIARNAVIDSHRKSRLQVAPLDQAHLEFDQSHLPGEILARDQEIGQLHQALLGLKEVYRSVLILRFLVGLSNAEVSRILGRSEGAVRVLQHRALKRLKRIMVDKDNV